MAVHASCGTCPVPLRAELGMSERQFIAEAGCTPQIVKAMEQAFDQAWTEIAGDFVDSPSEIQSARLSLARAMLSSPVKRARISRSGPFRWWPCPIVRCPPVSMVSSWSGHPSPELVATGVCPCSKGGRPRNDPAAAAPFCVLAVPMHPFSLAGRLLRAIRHR